MNELRIFENPEFGSIRTVEVNGEPWFVGKDVAEILGYEKPTDSVRKRVDDEDRGISKMETPSGKQNMTIINESGLYSLVLGSKLPTAKKFKRWVTSDVLPSIRKHGLYAMDEILANPDVLINALTELKEERQRRKKLESETVELSRAITEMQPKVNYVDIVLKSKNTVNISQIAQDYGMTPNRLNKLLADLRVQRKVGGQWLLYKDYLPMGYVQSETVEIERSSGIKDTVMHTKWTQKGRLFLYELLKENGVFPMIEKTA